VRASVVIPTRDRPESLERTLAAIQPLLCAGDELIVVDDAPSGSGRAISARGGVSSLASNGQGLAAARNAGAAAASGDLVVFCDDDVTPARAWLDAYRAAFVAYPELAAAGGPVLPRWEVPPPSWVLAYVAAVPDAGVYALLPPPPADRIGRDIAFNGCNMAFRRDVLRVLRFPPELVGGETIGSGDTGILRALRGRGALLGCIREATVHHHIGSERLSIGYFRRWARHLGGTLAYEALRGARVSARAHALRTLTHDGWRVPLGFAVWPGRSPRALNRQIRALATIEQLRYALRLHRDPLRRAAVLEGI
jgi:glucosyl-dolichyl phosphate glucuronosyltransferase